ncbi:VCBS domain-containing protein [Marinobacterium sp. xm-a-152]|uniref:VCBS domain-containing protein n=1 Tax=Marinobacterium sp. xm-a-152 TaxID=2497733 RepID=UPI00156A410D|nr:VCBS domain-containing protein [Marinobacterium sp. xm-a-152]NRP15380.1 Cadherin domain protein [Marinobacterium sp. xm-a-152]
MKKKFDINASHTKRVGMLALFGAFLEGCGGGGVAGNLISVGGKAIKGPLEGAEVFADYNENGVWDANEPKTTTNADGTYDLDVTQSSSIIVNTLATTIDTSTGNLIGAGTVLKAPAGATVVSPTTTLLASGVDEAVLKASLGIPASVDLNSFDPFADGADSTAALAYEKASITVFATVKAIQAAAVAAGGDSDAAFEAALSSVVELVQKTPTVAGTSVFEDTTLLSDALDSVSTQLAESDANFDDTAFDAVSSDVATATATVYTAVQSITDIQSDSTSAVVTVATETLTSQITSAVDGSGSITLTDSTAFDNATAAVNLAPTDITFSNDGIEFLEGIASGSVIGSFAVVDPNSGDSADFEIVSGGDASSFTLTQDGILKFVGTADYETKSSYSVTVKVTDGGGKTRTETFELSLVDVTEDSVITVGASDSAAESVTEDAAATLTSNGTLTVTDDDGDGAFNTSVVYKDSASTNSQALGALTITAAGSWSYSVDSDAAAIQQLGDGEVIKEVFTVTTADGKDSQDITITINGADDAAVVSGDVTGAVTEDGTLTDTGTLSISDTDSSDSPSFADVASTASDNGYGSFELSNGTWTYTLDNAVPAVQALGDGKALQDTITFTATDGTEQVVTVTINGADDASVVSGTVSGSVTEETGLTATGDLVITDTDSDDAPSFADVSSSAGDNGFGSFTLVDGTWTYTLDNANADVQALGEGESLSDSYTFTATDGATQSVSVTINGSSDTFSLTSGLATLTDYVDGLDITGVQYVSLDEVQGDTDYSLQVAGEQTFFLDRANLASGFDTNGFLGYDSALQFDLSSIAVGSGTGSVNITLLDGENALRAQGERELIITLDVSWSTDASGATSLTVDSARDFWDGTSLDTEGVAVNDFAGVIINDDLNGANVDNQNSNVFEFTFDELSPSDIISSDGTVLTIELAPALALIDTLTYTVASVEEKVFDLTSEDGYYFFSIETDIPLVSSTGNNIESIQGALDIIEVASNTDLDPYEAYLTTEVVIAGDEGSNQLQSTSAASEVLIGFGGNDYFKLTVENGASNESDIDLIVDYTSNLEETDGIVILSDNGAVIDKADVAIDEEQGSSVITYNNGSEVVYLAFVEGVTGLTTDDLLVISDL